MVNRTIQWVERKSVRLICTRSIFRLPIRPKRPRYVLQVDLLCSRQLLHFHPRLAADRVDGAGRRICVQAAAGWFQVAPAATPGGAGWAQGKSTLVATKSGKPPLGSGFLWFVSLRISKAYLPLHKCHIGLCSRFDPGGRTGFTGVTSPGRSFRVEPGQSRKQDQRQHHQHRQPHQAQQFPPVCPLRQGEINRF